MPACEGCPAIERFENEHLEAQVYSETESDGRLAWESFARTVEPIFCQIGINAIADKIKCSSIPELGECMHEQYVRRKVAEMMPAALEKIDTDANFLLMTRELNGFEGQ